MANLSTMIRTLKTTSNFWQAFLLKKAAGKRRIVFRNGVVVEISRWADYCKIRDFFQYLDDKQVNIKRAGAELVASKGHVLFGFSTLGFEDLALFKLIVILDEQSWIVNQTAPKAFEISRGSKHFKFSRSENGLFEAKSEQIQLVGPVDSLESYFTECERGLYDHDYKNKTVLDVGGFCGETAVFFASQGAKKVIVYEPVKAHHELIWKNIELNKINAQVFEEGLGEKTGSLTINYEATDMGFGVLSKGTKTLSIQIKSAQDILSQSQADIAKIDCEGAETSLIQVNKETLRKTGYYIIEAHTKAIQEQLTEKFIACGFTQPRQPEQIAQETTIIYFQRT